MGTVTKGTQKLKEEIRVSIIITTYNWPDVLEKIISALALQTYLNFQVIIADDGSGQTTFDYVQRAKAKYPFEIVHVWQPDEGFQAARIRNKAAAKAEGDYLIFLDGDCIPFSHFVARHVKLAEKGWLVAGNRILLSQRYTQQILESDIQLNHLKLTNWFSLKLSNDCNRLLPLVFIPYFPRKLKTSQWKGVKTCNMGLWKEAFISVNGFDESFTGWGHEDSDLVLRLLKSGIKRKEGRFALPVIHCWHKEQDRSLQTENLARLYHRLTDDTIWSTLGFNQHL